MRMILALMLSASAAGYLAPRAMQTVANAAFAYSERCERSGVPVNGRYPAFTWDCILADWWVYGGASLPMDICELADAEPTDRNLEACYGVEI